MTDYEDEGGSSNGSTYAHGPGRMRLRQASQRRRPGRYREADEIPDPGRPSWVHPDPVFNPVLASFVSPITLPLDHPDPSPSRAKYHKWLTSQGVTEEQHIQMIQNGKGVSKNVNLTTSLPDPKASKSSSSKGPTIVHLPPQGPGQLAINDGQIDSNEAPSQEDDDIVSYYQMSTNDLDNDSLTMVSLSFHFIPFVPDLHSSCSPSIPYNGVALSKLT